MGDTDSMDLATAERSEFADLLSSLSPDQWEHPTLCPGWRVRDVAAHAFSFDEVPTGELVGIFVRGLTVDRINELALQRYRSHTTAALCELARRHTRPGGLGKGFGGRTALTDNMIHQQDIRRPLGLPRTIPTDRLVTALSFARTSPLIRGAWRARGVRLAATDVPWAAGSGPEVTGTGEALLMTMAGRPSALGDLQGDGVLRLRRQIGHRD